jgi:chromosome segregation ATPase
VSDAITRLQRERDLTLRRIDELHVHYKRELKKKDDYHHTFNQGYILPNAPEESPQMRSVRRECEKRVSQYEERLSQLQSDLDAAVARQVAILQKANKELNDAREEADDAQRGAMTMFNEQKRHESHIDRSNIAVDKMRDESVRLRSKINDLREERSNLKKQQESRIAEDEAILM